MRGTELKSTIDNAVGQTRQQSEAAHQKLRKASADLDRLLRKQADAATALARVVVTHLGSHSRGGALASQLRQAMAMREEELAGLQRTAKALRKKRQQALEKLQLCQANQNQTDEAKGDLEKACLDSLAKDEQLVQAQAQAAQLSEQIRRTRLKLETATADAAEKAPAYESNPLFAYLLERRFGQKGYDAGAITERLDGWVANVVQFQRYFPDYQRLQAIPSKIADHLSYLEGLQHNLNEKIAHTQRKALTKWPGYEDSVAAFLLAKAYADQASEALADVDSALQQTDERLSKFSRGEDKHTVGAMDRVKDLVIEGKRDRAQLLVEASDTTEDDRLLDLLEGLRRDILDAIDQVNRAKAEHVKTIKRQQQAEEFARRFERENLGRSNKRYSSTNSTSVAEAILLGQALDSVFDSIRRDVRTITPPSTSSSSSGGWGGGSSGGGFGGGGFSGGGGFGGGGFSTGGGF